METLQAPPSKEAIDANDEALNEMFSIDRAKGLSVEDEQTYRELIESQRAAHIATRIEVKGPSGESEPVVVRSIGDKALSQSGLAVNSEGWRTEEK
jgi:hypothetical protein